MASDIQDPSSDLEAAYEHLRRADSVLGGLIDRFGPFTPRRGTEPYPSLLRSILYQQLAGPAASAILRRFFALYGDGRAPRPMKSSKPRTTNSAPQASRVRRPATSATSLLTSPRAVSTSVTSIHSRMRR